MQKIGAAPAVVALSFVISVCAGGQQIHLKTRTFDPAGQGGGDLAVMVLSAGDAVASDSGMETGSESRRGSLRGNAAQVHRIVEFDHPPGVDDLDALLQAGGQVTGALPDNAVMVSVAGRLSSMPEGAIWSGPMEPGDKVSPALGMNRAVAMSAAAVFPVIVEFHPDVDAAQQARVEAATGVVFIRPAGLMTIHAIVQADRSAVMRLAARDEVSYIFPADPALLTGTGAYPCAGMLTTTGIIGQYSNITHGWDVGSDNIAHLSYFFGALTPKVATANEESEILRAFEQWTSIVNVTFQPGAAAALARTVAIEFASGAHGDNYPFDGPGGMLAHTFYPVPVNAEPIAGDMHFDADEAWHVGSDTDIYTVALHEAGHALGLTHSDNPGDVMYPYYHRGMALSANDIGAALELYPAAGTPPATVSASPVTVSTGNTVTSGSGTPGQGTTNIGTTVATTTNTTTAPAPLVLTINPASSTAQSAAFTLSGTLTGGGGSDSVVWQTDHDYTGVATLSGAGAWTASNIPLVTGANTLTVTAYDTLGQVTTESTVETLQSLSSTTVLPIDVSILTPVSPVVAVATQSISVSGKASGGAGITEITWQTSNGATGTACGTGTWIATGIPIPVGNTTVVLRAVDSKGASAWVALVAVRS